MSDAIPFTPHEPGAIARIHAQLAAGAASDVSQFWRDVALVRVPLSAAVKGDSNQREVTFLWRSAEPLQGVYVRLNRITDKKSVAKGLMTPLPASDVWFLTLRLPASYCGSYTIVEIPDGTGSEQIAQLGSRFSPLSGQADPLNPAVGINVRGLEESLLALDRAPHQREWATQSAPVRGTLSSSFSRVAGHQRRIRLYLPDVPVSEPLGLLVVPDAEIWFERLGLPAAIDHGISSGRLGPLAVLGVDNLDGSDRNTLLGGRKALVLDIAQRLVPQLRIAYPDRVWAGREKTVFAGQSLGGVTAFMAALYAPDTFGCVLSHSPSMWWTPDESKPPSMFSESAKSWVSEQVLAMPPDTVRVQLCVGSLEGATVAHVEQLHMRLVAAGVESEMSIYTGGHDYAWWRGALIEGLANVYAQV
ncbi:alpha/beta hydrolase-fold protein [Pseudescherichia sp.]|uniref:alpha/beta hydrolase-fold protein n=1 Tax=Pseudescherichia sp. TaxID=2055881 RepID=UPI0028A0100A|nr:alpha/beta hydrolase-fold protein [Pseudescherichia sp.]